MTWRDDTEAAALLAEYRAHRSQGHRHHDALKALARRFDLDHRTAARKVALAEVAERLNQRRAK